jgi:hypothetical protein
MEKTGTMMIHDGMSPFCSGNAAALREMADLLDKLSDTIAGIYADRSGREGRRHPRTHAGRDMVQRRRGRGRWPGGPHRRTGRPRDRPSRTPSPPRGTCPSTASPAGTRHPPRSSRPAVGRTRGHRIRTIDPRPVDIRPGGVIRNAIKEASGDHRPFPHAPDELEELLSDPARPQARRRRTDSSRVRPEYARSVHAKDKDIAGADQGRDHRVLAELLETTARKPPSSTSPADRHPSAARRVRSTTSAPPVPPWTTCTRTRRRPPGRWHGNGSLPNGADLQAKAAEARDPEQLLEPVPRRRRLPDPRDAQVRAARGGAGVVHRPPPRHGHPDGVLRLPIPTVDDTSHASSVLGGVIAYWTEEAARSPSLGVVRPGGPGRQEAHRLLRGSERAARRRRRPGSGWFEQRSPGDLLLRGRRVHQRLGRRRAPRLPPRRPAAVSVSKETGQAADTIVWENIVKMYAGCSRRPSGRPSGSPTRRRSSSSPPWRCRSVPAAPRSG